MKAVCKEYYDRMYICEGQKWDLEFEVRKRDFEVTYKKSFSVQLLHVKKLVYYLGQTRRTMVKYQEATGKRTKILPITFQYVYADLI